MTTPRRFGLVTGALALLAGGWAHLAGWGAPSFLVALGLVLLTLALAAPLVLEPFDTAFTAALRALRDLFRRPRR